MPYGESEFFAYRGTTRNSQHTVPTGRLNSYNARTIRRFHTESVSCKNETFLVKYLHAPVGATDDFYYHYTFSGDLPIEGVLSILNDSANLNNDEEFVFSFSTPSWGNKINCDVLKAGQYITFKATKGLALKMGLIPNKEYYLTNGIQFIGEYNIITMDAEYYDLKVDGKVVARSHPSPQIANSIIYATYLDNRDKIRDFQIWDSNNRQVDISYTVEVGYLNTITNFRDIRFSGYTDMIHTHPYTKAGYKNMTITDRDHIVSEANSTVTYVGYNLISKVTIGSPYITPEFTLTESSVLASESPNLGVNQANVTHYLVVGATVSGRRHSNITVLPVDTNGDIITMESTKSFNNPLSQFVFNPEIDIDGVSTSIPGIASFVIVNSFNITPGYCNETIFQSLLDNTPITSIVSNGTVTITSPQPFILIGPHALNEYLREFEFTIIREYFYETITSNTFFNDLSDVYTFNHVNANFDRPLYYTIEDKRNKYFINELASIPGLQWFDNDIGVYNDLRCYAVSSTGQQLYNVYDFNFELILR